MDPSPRPRRRWVPIAAGIAILLVFLCIGAIVAVVTVMRQAVEVQTVAETDATAEFDMVRARFQNRPPLLELGRNGRAHYTDASQPESAATIERLCFLAWDAQEQKLARLSLPFWLLRLKSGPIKLNDYGSDLGDGSVDLRAEDIERYGPGIILDHTGSSGDRVLFWAQ